MVALQQDLIAAAGALDFMPKIFITFVIRCRSYHAGKKDQQQRNALHLVAPAVSRDGVGSPRTRTGTGTGDFNWAAFGTSATQVPRTTTSTPIQIQITSGLTNAVMLGWPSAVGPL